MNSYIIYTNNSEKYIKGMLEQVLPIKDDDELIIFDNMSTDNTVPIIVSTVDLMAWVDEKNRYKFYINSKKETKKTIINKALKIAKGKPIIINKKTKIDEKEVVEC